MTITAKLTDDSIPTNMLTDTASISKLIDARVRVYLACTGAGAGLQSALWNVPGCSSFFVGAEFPYDQTATERFLGFRPEKFVSVDAAIALALESYSRACIENGRVTLSSPIGLGLTASAASLRAHRGDHRICAAVATRQGVYVADVVLEKGVGLAARVEDGQLADRIGLSLLLRAAERSLHSASRPRFPFEGDPPPAETFYTGEGDPPATLTEVTEQARQQFFFRGFHTAQDKRLPVSVESIGRRIIFPGSFDPPHEGHFNLAQRAVECVGPASGVVFAVTANPPHKMRAPLSALLERVALLRGHDRMFTEDDALFLDKAKRYPNHAFIVGADTFQRLLDPKWGPEIAPMAREFVKRGACFLVFGRLVDGVWTTREDVLREVARVVDINTRADLNQISAPIEGRWDISSSELRAAAEREELARRIQAVDDGTAQTTTWEQVKNQIKTKRENPA